MKMRFAPVSVLALLLAAPATAQTVAAAAPATTAKTVDADPAIWVVKDADTTIYLFGTVHVLKPGLSWFDEAVKDAFDKSGNIVMELPPQDPAKAGETQQIVLGIAQAKDGKTLTEKLPADKRAAYAAVLAQFGQPANAFDAFEPWFAAVILSQLALAKAGYAPDSGAEALLTAAAKAANKPATGLETLQQQLGYFHSLPEADQVKFLLSTVAEMAEFGTMLEKLVDKWTHGDPRGLADLINKDIADEPTLYKVLLKDRNTRWAAWIDSRMKQPGTVFVAVGAGHLAGPDSVQEQLKPYHLDAVRVNY
ncbi:MAG: TraB/GumN family protein [Sphingomonas sp.]